MSVQVFAVFQEGVYRHKCGGVFTTREAAEAGARACAAADRDSYHSWDVVPFTLDAVTFGDEEVNVYSVRKNETDQE